MIFKKFVRILRQAQDERGENRSRENWAQRLLLSVSKHQDERGENRSRENWVIRHAYYKLRVYCYRALHSFSEGENSSKHQGEQIGGTEQRIDFVQIWNLIKKVAAQVLLFFIPALCSYCKAFLTERTIFCSDCSWKMFPVVSKNIDITRSFSVIVFAITDYKDPLRKLILSKQWSDWAASYHLGTLLWNMTPISSLDYDVIVPVPLHWTRYASRGFNQAEEIARVIQKKRKVPLQRLLKRVKKTVFQFELVSSMRGTNVKDAFVLHSNNQDYKGKHILLIDDLMTTGSTIREAAKELLKLQPKKITVAVVCRVL